MMRTVFILLFCLTVQDTWAQEPPEGPLLSRWRNSAGASVHLLQNNGGVGPAFGLYYNPQINIINKYADFSLAATMPMTLGAHVKNAAVDRTFFYGHIPAVLETNIGHYSTRDFRSGIGVGIGAGYAAQINGNAFGSGPVGTVAVRTWFFKGSLTLRYMFHYNLVGNGFLTHAVAVAVNFGRYFEKLRQKNKMSRFQGRH